MKDTLKRKADEARTEVQERWKRFNDLKATVEKDGDESKIAELETEYKAYEESVTTFNDADGKHRSWLEMEAAEKGDTDEPEGKGEQTPDESKMSPGQRVINSPQYKALVDSKVLSTDRAKFTFGPVPAMTRTELKALITGASDTSGGAFIINQRLPGYLELLQRVPRVANLVTTSETNSDIVEWVSETGFTNAAAEVAEATTVADGAKPESTLALAVVSSPVQQIAHFMNVTRRALADSPQVADLIDSELRRGIELRLDTQLINGNGTSPNLRGILNTAGIATQARATDSRADAVRKAVTTIRLAFLEPNAVVMHPSDVQTLVLEKNTNADYYYGSPAGTAASSPTLWGLQIVESPVIAAGTALVGDFRSAILFVRDAMTILTSENVNDYFIRNILTLLGEARFGFAVPRPAAFAQVTGM